LGHCAVKVGGVDLVKSELVQRLAPRNAHLYQRDMENIVDAILGEIADALARSDRVELRGFGVFSTERRRARTGRNPRSGDSVLVTEKHVPASKTSKEVRKLLNRP
jgi:integration host factor subunit beta